MGVSLLKICTFEKSDIIVRQIEYPSYIRHIQDTIHCKVAQIGVVYRVHNSYSFVAFVCLLHYTLHIGRKFSRKIRSELIIVQERKITQNR